MSFTTVAFFVFLLAGIVVYYVLPKIVQWIWLLILSYIYYFTFSIKASLFMVFATVTIYFGGIWLQNIQNSLCIQTGIRSIDARVIKSCPMCP